MVGVEVQGPSHYLEGGKEFNGSTKWKKRVMERMGWRVEEIGYREWKEKGEDLLKEKGLDIL